MSFQSESDGKVREELLKVVNNAVGMNVLSAVGIALAGSFIVQEYSWTVLAWLIVGVNALFIGGLIGLLSRQEEENIPKELVTQLFDIELSHITSLGYSTFMLLAMFSLMVGVPILVVKLSQQYIIWPYLGQVSVTLASIGAVLYLGSFVLMGSKILSEQDSESEDEKDDADATLDEFADEE